MPPSLADHELQHDSRLQAAVGYFELGMLAETWEELRTLVDSGRGECPGAVKLRTLLFLREKRWQAALEEAEHLCICDRGSTEGYIHAAYCLHEMGRTADARRLLEEGPGTLETEPLYHYNLACYQVLTGEPLLAMDHLHDAFEMDPELRKTAEKDDDLAAIKGQF